MNQLNELIEKSRKIVMSPEDKEEQRQSFAFGNANIENSKVTKAVVKAAAKRVGHRG